MARRLQGSRDAEEDFGFCPVKSDFILATALVRTANTKISEAQFGSMCGGGFRFSSVERYAGACVWAKWPENSDLQSLFSITRLA